MLKRNVRRQQGPRIRTGIAGNKPVPGHFLSLSRQSNNQKNGFCSPQGGKQQATQHIRLRNRGKYRIRLILTTGKPVQGVSSAREAICSARRRTITRHRAGGPGGKACQVIVEPQMQRILPCRRQTPGKAWRLVQGHADADACHQCQCRAGEQPALS